MLVLALRYIKTVKQQKLIYKNYHSGIANTGCRPPLSPATASVTLLIENWTSPTGGSASTAFISVSESIFEGPRLQMHNDVHTTKNGRCLTEYNHSRHSDNIEKLRYVFLAAGAVFCASTFAHKRNEEIKFWGEGVAKKKRKVCPFFPSGRTEIIISTLTSSIFSFRFWGTSTSYAAYTRSLLAYDLHLTFLNHSRGLKFNKTNPKLIHPRVRHA